MKRWIHASETINLSPGVEHRINFYLQMAEEEQEEFESLNEVVDRIVHSLVDGEPYYVEGEDFKRDNIYELAQNFDWRF